MSRRYGFGQGGSDEPPAGDGGVSEDLFEVGEEEDLIDELDEEQLTKDLNELASLTHTSKFPIWLIVKIVKFILLLLVLILKLLKSRKFGLKEIKREIREIEKKLDDKDDKKVPSIVTTGPVGRHVGVGSVVVKVLNNTNMPQTVTVTVYDLTECPKIDIAQATAPIPPCCAETFILDAPVQYEVEVSGLVKGVYVWAAARLQPPVVPVAASVYVAANTFRHHEFVRQVPCPPVNQQG